MRKLKLLLGPMRVPFLLLPPACVALGAGTACWKGYAIHWPDILWVLIGAVSAHISVNAFNEYFDFQSGLDHMTRRTPFSGGSGTLPAHPEMVRPTFYLAWSTLILTAAIGVYFVRLRGWQLMPLGLFGLLLLITYTTWWVYHPVMCLIAPGLGFGVLMVMGTHFALAGAYDLTAFTASLVPTFLVSDLLLLNQFPDVEADRDIGRKHFPVTAGRNASAALYGFLLLLAYLTIIFGVAFKLLPVQGLIALLSAVVGWRTFLGVRRNANDVGALLPSMGQNVMINLSTPALLALALFMA